MWSRGDLACETEISNTPDHRFHQEFCLLKYILSRHKMVRLIQVLLKYLWKHQPFTCASKYALLGISFRVSSAVTESAIFAKSFFSDVIVNGRPFWNSVTF